jgi:dipeptidyl aminopeptidase/acylaminoacyl peptidase
MRWPVLLMLTAACHHQRAPTTSAEIVSLRSGELTLQGSLYRPAGRGPFPAVLYNHGSAPGMLSVQAAEALGPVFTARGWIFFMPYRRGQLKSHPDVAPNRIAVAGNSFGGIESVLGAERGTYCAAIDSAGAAMSWASAPELQERMLRAVRNARVPIFFFQAENDFDLAPTRVLSAAMKQAGKPFEVKIYPPFGSSAKEGHTLGYFGSSVWGDDVFRFLAQHCP